MSTPLTDPYFETGTCVDRLFKQWTRTPRLIVAVDIDDTILDFHKTGATYPATIAILKQCNALDFHVVVYTASAKERHPTIRDHMAALGVQIAAVNANPFPLPYGNDGKIFYNLFLDDRAGLGQAYDILRLTIDRIKAQTIQL